MTNKQIQKTIKADYILLALEVKVEVQPNSWLNRTAYVVSPKYSIESPETKLEAAVKQYLKISDKTNFVINSRTVVNDVAVILS